LLKVVKLAKKFLEFHQGIINLPFNCLVYNTVSSFTAPVKIRYVGIDELFRKVFQNDFSGFIAIEGRGRSGKSTLATWLGLYFQYLKTGSYPRVEEFRKWLEDHVKFGASAEEEALNWKKEVIIFNEAVIEAYKRLAMSSSNVSLIRLFTILQRLNNLYIFVVPSYMMLDADIREYFTDIIIDVIRRGTAEVYVGITKKIRNVKKKFWYFAGRLDFYKLPKGYDEIFDEFDREKKEEIYKPIQIADGIVKRVLPTGETVYEWVGSKKKPF